MAALHTQLRKARASAATRVKRKKTQAKQAALKAVRKAQATGTEREMVGRDARGSTRKVHDSKKTPVRRTRKQKDVKRSGRRNAANETRKVAKRIRTQGDLERKSRPTSVEESRYAVE